MDWAKSCRWSTATFLISKTLLSDYLHELNDHIVAKAMSSFLTSHHGFPFTETRKIDLFPTGSNAF